MSWTLIAVLGIRLMALGWSAVLLGRLRDWRIGFLTAFLGLLAAGPFHALAAEVRGGPVGASEEREELDLAVSAAALLTVLCLGHSLTRRQRVEEDLRESEARWRSITENSPDHIMTLAADGTIEFINRTVPDLDREKVLGTPVFRYVPEEFRPRMKACFSRVLETGQPDRYEVAYITEAGEVRTFESRVRQLVHADGRIGFAVSASDVTEIKRQGEALAHQASHDALTGLFNRRELELRLERALEQAKKEGAQHALCYLDLDQFKIVNDTVGHVAGDELLRQVAELLQARVRKVDTLARLGGDEFSLILEGCPLPKAIEIAEKLVATLEEFRFTWQGQCFEIGVSIGLVPITGQAESTVELLTLGDLACYTAKDLGRNRVHVYHTGEGELDQRRVEILRAAELSAALEADRFRLHCQPIFRLTREGPAVAHYEILLRLLDGDGALVLPSAFVPAAERYGTMAKVDRWVIRNAFRRCAEMPGRMCAGLALNLSGSSLNDDSLVAYVLEQRDEVALAARRVCFEITETAAIRNLDRAADFIHQLRSEGFRFALDDFGSGLSSFRYLKHLPVDFLKIDGGFVRDMVASAADRAIVAAINEVAHVMRMETIAECAETAATVECLQELGVDLAQGFALGQVVPLDEIVAKAAL